MSAFIKLPAQDRHINMESVAHFALRDSVYGNGNKFLDIMYACGSRETIDNFAAEVYAAMLNYAISKVAR